VSKANIIIRMGATNWDARVRSASGDMVRFDLRAMEKKGALGVPPGAYERVPGDAAGVNIIDQLLLAAIGWLLCQAAFDERHGLFPHALPAVRKYITSFFI
jgi:hypothetical protein